jgi:RHS repeat-associated protein
MKLADRTHPSAWKPCETPSHSVLSVRRRTRHAAFGLATSEQNLANPTAQPADHIFGFTGREQDDESDLNFYRARYYDPTVARFISQDPIGFEAGDANLYRYVGNGPTNGIDPSGLQSPFSVGGYNSSTITGERYDPMRPYRNIGFGERADKGLLQKYRRLMREMIYVGDKLWSEGPSGLSSNYRVTNCTDVPGSSGKLFAQITPVSTMAYFPIMWPRLKAALDYAHRTNTHYGPGGVLFTPTSSFNVPIIPGVNINRDAFFNSAVGAIAELAHEPQHDLMKHFVDLKRSYPDYHHDQIRKMFPNNPFPQSDNDYTLFMNFLFSAKCTNGKPLWVNMRQTAGLNPRTTR